MLKKSLRRRKTAEVSGASYFFTAGLGAKESANALAFGTPTPVTLSQPTLVCRYQLALHCVMKP